MLATLLLSQGTPMLLGGDEFGRTQVGNNNAYCQDNDISWVDWAHGEQGEALTRFAGRLATLRATYPVLRQSRFLTAKRNEELDLKGATWITATGEQMTPEYWQQPAGKSVGLLLDGRVQASGKSGSEATLLLIFNAHHDVVVFTLPKVAGGRNWLRLIDTNRPEDNDDDPENLVRLEFGHRYEVTGRSLVLLLLHQTKIHRRPYGEAMS